MLKRRVITALIGLPLVLAIFVFGVEWIAIFSLFCGVALSAFELARILYPLIEQVNERRRTLDVLTIGTMAGATAVYYFMGLSPFPRALEHSILLFMISTVAIAFIHSDPKVGIRMAMAYAFTVLYCASAWTFITNLYFRSDDSRFLILLLTIVWAGQLGSYFGDKKFGKTKLAPTLSPHKTREGCLFGVIASVGASLFVYFIYREKLGTIGQIIASAALGGIASQVGDLFETMIKRYGNVQYSSDIFPGQGGLLDKFGAALLAAPVLWTILSL